MEGERDGMGGKGKRRGREGEGREGEEREGKGRGLVQF